MRAESRQEKGRFSSFLFLTLQTTLVSLYLEKKYSERFLPPLSIPSAISLQIFPGARAQRQKEQGWALTLQTSPGRGKLAQSRCPWSCMGTRKTIRLWRMCPGPSRSCVTMQNLRAASPWVVAPLVPSQEARGKCNTGEGTAALSGQI